MKDFVKKASQKISKLSDEQLEQLIEGLNSENDTLDCVLESLSIGLVIVDEQWHVMHTNKAAERLLCFTVRPSERGDSEGVWSYIGDETVRGFLKECADEQKVNVSDEFSISSDENVRFVVVSVLPLVKKDYWENGDVLETRIVGSIITVDDITQKRQQEILLHRMESLASLTNLAASVAHEIKNPLGAISIHIQLLQKAIRKAREGDGMLPATKFMEDYIAVINEEIDNLNKIVLDFLFAVRPVQASMVLSEPDTIVDRFAAFFKPEFDNKCVTLKLLLCKKSPRLMIDEKLFREVLVNITQNALAAIMTRFPPEKRKDDEDCGCTKYEKGELVIESFVKGDKYILTIADNGCGMDEKTASHIFEPYYTTKANGTGLGLTMVYKIIKEFRGDIDVKSVLGHGTVFTIMIPVPQGTTRMLSSQEGSK